MLNPNTPGSISNYNIFINFSQIEADPLENWGVEVTHTRTKFDLSPPHVGAMIEGR